MAIVFNKTPKNKKFNYRPLYYDQKKEEREKRMKTALEEGEENYEQALRDRIQNRWKRNVGSKERKASNQRLIIIVLVIAMLFYLAFFL